ncbi:DUF3311 domain-containing protein [Actinokineospora inagensis]|uniref:DUF3311 domain-containing protein n=1 Tax=Actinokineospora inagensis TaxID=103730 RepID=UPI0003F92561|nr:DUF3311 domain-containing protein [Actinokineospora inagensis]
MTHAPGRSGIRWSNWNLLLLIPLVLLVTPIFNRTDPRLFGMPFFYWFQFAGVVPGVLVTSIVYLKTRGAPTTPAPGDEPGVDTLDEGVAR